jgi:uncharacterized protein
MAHDYVEVVLALSEKQCVVEVEHTAGMTALEAVTRSGLLERFPGVASVPLVLGRFGVRIDHDHVLKPGDRVEICRPLRSDPREKRKELWRRGKVIGSH